MRVRIILCGVALVALNCCGGDDTEQKSISEVKAPEKVARHDEATPDATVPTRGRGDDGWRVRRWASKGQIEGYTTRTSGTPGTAVGFKVSTTARSFRVFAHRIGAYEGGSSQLVWASHRIAGGVQPKPEFAPYETRTVVAPWRENLTIDTSGWEPGFYVFRLKSRDGWENPVPYIVSSPTAADTVAVGFPVTTWQAYNVWGGYSLYDGPSDDRRSWAVSFDRPYFGVGGMNDFATAIVPFVVEAERAGIPLSWFANTDLHNDPGLLDDAHAYVSIGHDEYWTSTMRDRVTKARDAGTNLAFFGANTMYWRVRLSDPGSGPGRLMTGYRSDAHLDPLWSKRQRETTARFRDVPVPRPENSLTGMLYECYPVDTDYVVAAPRWFGFAGTGVRRGSVIQGLVGGEADRVYPDRATPRPLQVLSYKSYSCRGTQTSTQSVYYTVPSGAGVFTAGTLRWGCALADRCDRRLGDRTRDFARKVTANILRTYALGPAGPQHPARDNVSQFLLPLVNSVSAS